MAITTYNTWSPNDPDRPKILAIDLDNTIAEFEHGWKGPNVFGDPIPGMKEVLNEIQKDGKWKIIIHTCRPDDDNLRRYLRDNDIPYDSINDCPWIDMDGIQHDRSKMYADVYLDDRAIGFNGKTEGLAQRIKDFVPWERDE